MKEANTAIKESSADQPSLQVLTFLLDHEIYGTDISQIQEVLEYIKVTPVPRTPDFMLGVINLRGHVVPVVDLRRQFEMEVSEPTVDTCIVIVEIMVDDESTSMGLLADGVKEVVELEARSITPAPRIGSRIDTKFISGMCEHEDSLIIILNLSKIFSSDEISEVMDSVSSKAAKSIETDSDDSE